MRIKINRQHVQEVFETAKDQGDYLVAIYRLVFPDFDELLNIPVGSVCCSDSTWKDICRLCMDWDQKHVSSLSGGAWLNYGFANDSDLTLKDFEIEIRENMLERRKPLLAA